MRHLPPLQPGLKPDQLVYLAVVALCFSLLASVHANAETEYPAPPYQFAPEDEQLLEEIQRGCFEFFWKEVGDPAPLVKDRVTDPRVSSLAGVGFQLSSLPIGVERGWVTRDEAEQRCLAILRAIVPRTDNKKFGIYLHYVELNDGGMHHYRGPQVQASTVDHALLQAGAMAAASYFGGEASELVDRIVADANWRVYQTQPEGYLSFGWRTENMAPDLEGPGDFRPWAWHKACCEDRLVTFLAVGSPTAEHAVPPEVYYRLQRVVKQHDDMRPYVVSWGGPLFTYFFSHCWIDCRGLGQDNPAAFGSQEPPIDWFENSRRAVLTHRQRCIEQAANFRTLGPDSWGLSPAADINAEGKISYIVPAVQPNMEGKDNFCGGTVAPYAAGSAIMFTPELSVQALRHFRQLEDEEGKPIVWRDLSTGGYGLLDSFNLDRTDCQGTPDYLSIDDGPMLLAIENARSGLLWRLFMEHPSAQLAVQRLGWKR